MVLGEVVYIDGSHILARRVIQAYAGVVNGVTVITGDGVMDERTVATIQIDAVGGAVAYFGVGDGCVGVDKNQSVLVMIVDACVVERQRGMFGV